MVPHWRLAKCCSVLVLIPCLFLVCRRVHCKKKDTFEAVIAIGRPPYFQCPKIEELSTYPLLTNPQCSDEFTYCAKEVAIPGSCPLGLFFNPRKLSCDAPIPESCYRDENEIVEPRAIVDEPSYNECDRRPCNFFPNGEDDDDGKTYIFCQFGKPKVRKCPRGSAFCTKVEDCVPFAEAHIFSPAEITEGKRESGNPIPVADEISTEMALSPELATRGSDFPVSIPEPENDVVIVQAPMKGIVVPADATWSKWYICPYDTYIVTITPKRATCMPIAPGRHPSRFRMTTHLHLAKKRRIYFPSSNCDKGRGGVLNSFSINRNSKLVEFHCSNDYHPPKAEWCPATKAICGLSFMHGKDKDVANVRAKCCSVQEPTFHPEEKLTFISYLDNLKGEKELTVEFNSTCGIDIPIGLEEKTMRLFYVSLGFTIDHVWDEIQRDLRARTKCNNNGNNGSQCYYPWEEYVVKNRKGRPAPGAIVVPPKTKIQLYQVYAQAGYFRVYTNLFVKKIEDGGKVVAEETWYGVRPEPPHHGVLPVAVLAENVTLEQVSAKVDRASNKKDHLCKFLNLTMSNNQEWETRFTSLIALPEGKEQGNWVDFKNCTKKYFVNTLKLGKKGGVSQLELGCRFLWTKRKKVKRPKRSVDGDGVTTEKPKKTGTGKPKKGDATKAGEAGTAKPKAGAAKGGKGAAKTPTTTTPPPPPPPTEKPTKPPKPPKLKVLEFSQPGTQKGGWDSEDTSCKHGASIGFQAKTSNGVVEDLRMVCSCPTDGNAIATKGGWSEAQICDPLLAISGFSPRFSDKGLTDLKIRCHHVPSIAGKCKAKSKKRLVAICRNNENATSCIFRAAIGVTYSLDKPTHIEAANFMESVGHTLQCSYGPLNRNFRKRYPAAAFWKDAYWHPMSQLTGQIFKLKPSSTTEIYQIVGHCGPYKVYTNRFIRVTNKDESTQEEFDIPPVPGPTAPPCWIHEFHRKGKRNIHDEAHKKLPPTKLIAIEQIRRNRTYYIQRPPRWTPSPDAIWTKWIICNNTAPNNYTHITDIRKSGILCQMIMSPGQVIPKNSTKFIPHKIPGLSLSLKDCTKGGGVVVGFKKEKTKPTEYFCSSTKPNPTPKEEWCPPKTAACGISVQYSPSTMAIENVRLRCCQLAGPGWSSAREGLAHIGTFDNSKQLVWRKFKFDTGYDGAVIHEKDRLLAKYWMSMGYTWDNAWYEVEDAIIYNVTCFIPTEKSCIFGWPNYKFSSSELFPVQKKIVVPPKSILQLYQLYVQVSFYRVYVSRFIEVIEDVENDVKYEEIRDIEIKDDDKLHIEGEDPLGGRMKWGVAPVILADNVTATEYATKLVNLTCSYHNMTGRRESDEVDLSMDGWKKCEKDSFLYKMDFVRNGDAKKGKVVDMKIDCRNVKTLTRSGKYMDADNKDPNIVSEGSVPKVPDLKKNLCKHGVYAGFQAMGYEYQMICSCPEEDEEKDIFALSDKSMCKPFHALQGILPGYSGTGSDKKLASLKKWCTEVPSAAKTCTPREIKKRMLVAKCKNDEDRARDCVFKVNIGVTYNLDSENNIRQANTLESVGHTIPCSAPALAETFQNTLKSPVWREPFWFPLSEIMAKMTHIQENSDTDIFQIVGTCGPYVVHTNKFIEDPEGDYEPDEELDLPLYEVPDLEKCWQEPDYKKKPKVDNIFEI